MYYPSAYTTECARLKPASTYFTCILRSCVIILKTVTFIEVTSTEVLQSPLQTLKNDTLIITKPDKGRGVVILSKCDYKQKVMNILSDRIKFKRITTK